MKRYPILRFILATLFSLIVLAQTTGNLSGTVKDPKGAVVVGAQVTVRHETTNETKTATTDPQGKFSITGLAPGNYVVSITRDGFKPTEQKVVIEDKRTATTEIKLDIAEVRGEVTTTAVGTIKPNTDPNYRALRDGKLGETYTVTNLTLKRDVATFVLKSGRISFLPPVLGRVAVGVFVGEGEFLLDPLLFIERDYLKMVTEKETFAEPFTRLVLFFSDSTYDEIKKAGQAAGAADNQLLDALKDVQDRMRDRERGAGENIEAEILTDLYNQKRAPSFNAFIDGKKRHQLVLQMRPYGAIDCEEVLLVNADRLAKDAGFLYASHLASEFQNKTASASEDKRVVDAEHYKIENAIKGDKLTANAECTLTALTDGERMLGIGLLPDLRVTRVLWGETEIDFIQEDKKKDGSLYVILPEPMTKGRKYKLTVEYQGEKVLRDAGGGNFAIGARTSWYPNVNTFKDRATFDLTFKVPKQFMLVSVGQKVKEWQDDDFAASQWVSETPLAVAGFNYGRFKMQELTDEQTKYKIEGYAVSEMPDGLRNTGIGGMAPTRLIGQSLAEAQNSMRIFTHFFGP
ncbi:MAG TPA: carboxypeptidase regulatory-like domain-containing protein, partial [Blastocatellia bacterium]|nr:carboxypeptidase regulatory-like domain-containing protein [Blastocatellia bacterium]